MRIDAVPIGKNPPEDINVIIEVSVGGEPIKYEMDKEAGAMYVDRFLYTPMRYPGNYGFGDDDGAQDDIDFDSRSKAKNFNVKQVSAHLFSSGIFKLIQTFCTL